MQNLKWIMVTLYLYRSNTCKDSVIIVLRYTPEKTYTSVIKNNNNVIVMNTKHMPYANCFYSKDNKQWNKKPFLSTVEAIKGKNQ